MINEACKRRRPLRKTNGSTVNTLGLYESTRCPCTIFDQTVISFTNNNKLHELHIMLLVITTQIRKSQSTTTKNTYRPILPSIRRMHEEKYENLYCVLLIHTIWDDSAI